VYAVFVRLKLYSTEVTQDGLDGTLIGDLVSRSSGPLACLMKELIPTQLCLHFCDEHLEVIGPGTQERVECSGFVHSKNIQRISITTPSPYAPA
jgi:hypothetical protein